MGNRRKTVYLTDHSLEEVFIVLTGWTPLPSPPEPQRTCLDYRCAGPRVLTTQAHLLPMPQTNAILEMPLSITRKIFSGDENLHSKPSWFFSGSEPCWASKPKPTHGLLYLQPISTPDYPHNKSFSSNVKL